MKTLFHVVLLSAFALNSFGNSINLKDNRSNWLSFNQTTKFSTQELMADKQALNLGDDDALKIKSEYVDNLGIKHVVTQQTYKNIVVEGATFLIHEKNNIVETANGHLIKNLNISVVPKISQNVAFEKAIKHFDVIEYAWENETYEWMLKQSKQNGDASFYPIGELVVFNPEFNQSSNSYKLAYKFDVFAVDPLFRKSIYVDANTGIVLNSIDKMHTCNHRAATGNTNYSGQVNFSVCELNNNFKLRNEQNCDIEVFNSNKTAESLPLSFEENSNQFNNSPSAVEVFWTLQQVYDYFNNTLGLAGIDNSNSPIYSWVNYKENFNNAFWNGTWLTFGEGDGEHYGPFTSPDIVAHEYMHGVTDYSNAKLAYYGESGALNESFSDIFGEVIEHYISGSNDWVFGAGVPLKTGKTGLRSLADPTSSLMTTQQPAAYQGPYWYNGYANNSGVHINSGVQNYWFYLLSEGGNVTNFNDNYFEVEGIGIEKATAIAYKNLTTYLTPNATYTDAYLGSIQAATDLFGPNSNEVLQTKAAWCAVNVGNACVPAVNNNVACNRNTDSLALVALYNSTNGNNWNNKWNLNHPINTWYGITVNSNGCVLLIDLHNNNLTGTLPAELGHLKHLKRLRLSNGFSSQGKISGIIPPAIGEMEALEIINISYQNLATPLPVELSNIKNLKTLNLAGNNFSGNLPAFFNNLIALQELDLANNNFNGSLPDLSLLQTLIILDLGFNNFTGTIPASFANLVELEWLNVKNNSLTGCFPGSLVSLCSHLSSAFNNNGWINAGNNLNQNWEDFCLSGSGSCNGETIIGPVYPGDFNQNGLVEISDLLYWGLAFEEEGDERPGATTSWNPQNCVEWQNFVNGINSKHQDADGNGIVDQNDIAVFIQNYDLGSLTSSNNNPPTSPVRYVLTPVNSVKNGEEIIITYDLSVESLINQPITAHGLACNINFNSLPVNSITVDFENTCLNQTEHLSIYDINRNTLNIAITKKDRSIEVCDNVVARVVVLMEEVQSGEPYVIVINNGNTISNNGELSGALNQSIYGVLSFDQTATPTFATQVQTTNEQCNTLGNAIVDVVGGVAPYTYSWSNGATIAEASNLPAGTYTVTVNDAINNSNTLNIEIGTPQPVFDYQTGEQLCGQNCSETLDLNGAVSGGYYKAKQLIESNAKLTENSQINFKAGDRIRLTTGFSTSQSQNFSANIGSCND